MKPTLRVQDVTPVGQEIGDEEALSVVDASCPGRGACAAARWEDLLRAQCVLWYPDRKYCLPGEIPPAALLAVMTVG